MKPVYHEAGVKKIKNQALSSLKKLKDIAEQQRRGHFITMLNDVIGTVEEIGHAMSNHPGRHWSYVPRPIGGFTAEKKGGRS